MLASSPGHQVHPSCPPSRAAQMDGSFHHLCHGASPPEGTPFPYTRSNSRISRHSWLQTNRRRPCAQHLIAEQELQGVWKYLTAFSLNIFFTIYLSMWAKIFNIMQSKQRNKWDIQVLIRLCLPSKPLISTFCSSNLPDYSNYNWYTFQFIQIKHFFF